MAPVELDKRDVVSSFVGAVSEVGGEFKIEVDVDGRKHTVDPRPIFEFERELLDDLINARATVDVSGGAVPLKGRWIHGWLSVKGEDYINNIWRAYQLFIKYIEVETSKLENVSTFKRSPGTYDTMYNYLILLEKLGLVERHRRTSVPQEEYENFVPEAFRKRTFVRLTSGFEGNEEEWNNPFRALYGKPEPEEEVEPELPPEGVDIDIEPMPPGEGEPEEEPEEVEEAEPEIEPVQPEEEPEGVSPRLGEFGPEETEEEEEEAPIEEVDPSQLPPENASIVDFPDKDGLENFIDSSFEEALQITLAQAPIETDATPSDFEPGQIAVLGPWVVGEATPGETTLLLVVSVRQLSDVLGTSFIPAGIQQNLAPIMERNNPYEDIFPSYEIVSAFNSAFMRLVDEVVRREQTELIWYDLREREMKEL